MEPIPGFLKGKIVCKCCRHIPKPNIKLEISEKEVSQPPQPPLPPSTNQTS